jgi:ABC-type uncharacterized transport system substrate-binding protein
MGLLHELLPNATTIAFLVNPANPATVTESSEMQAAAGALGQRIQVLNASTEREIDDAFESLRRLRADALLVAVDPFLFSRADQLVPLAARQSIPTLYFRREFAVAPVIAKSVRLQQEIDEVLSQAEEERGGGEMLRNALSGSVEKSRRPSSIALHL